MKKVCTIGRKRRRGRAEAVKPADVGEGFHAQGVCIGFMMTRVYA
jgi:hypothetical protein